MKRLADLIGTNYAYDSYADDITALKETEIDVAGVRFTPPAYERLRTKMWQGMRVIDSADSVRNYIFKQNMEAMARYEADSQRAEDFPKFQKGQTIVSYVKSLDSNHLYESALFLDTLEANALICFIALTRPKIQVLMKTDVYPFFKCVKSWLHNDGIKALLETNTEFMYYAFGIMLPVTLDITKTKEIILPGAGTYTKTSLIEDCLIFPANFGNEQLSSHPVWSNVLLECATLLEPKFDEINLSMRGFIARRLTQ